MLADTEEPPHTSKVRIGNFTAVMSDLRGQWKLPLMKKIV
ncbi:MAG: hypothetical protein EZS28_008951, partial [Streblomastix strix]